MNDVGEMSAAKLRDDSTSSTRDRPPSDGASSGTFPKKPKVDDFKFGKIIGEGSYSTVSISCSYLYQQADYLPYPCKVLKRVNIVLHVIMLCYAGVPG